MTEMVTKLIFQLFAKAKMKLTTTVVRNWSACKVRVGEQGKVPLSGISQETGHRLRSWLGAHGNQQVIAAVATRRPLWHLPMCSQESGVIPFANGTPSPPVV